VTKLQSDKVVMRDRVIRQASFDRLRKREWQAQEARVTKWEVRKMKKEKWQKKKIIRKQKAVMS